MDFDFIQISMIFFFFNIIHTIQVLFECKYVFSYSGKKSKKTILILKLYKNLNIL